MKYWNFYDAMGCCVESIEHTAGSTEQSAMEWWNDFIKGEEYQPEVSVVHLEDFDGREWKQTPYTEDDVICVSCGYVAESYDFQDGDHDKCPCCEELDATRWADESVGV